MSNGGYDDGYTSCPCFWGKTPGSYVLKLKEFRRSFGGLRVLDAGCGEGKNAHFFAEAGAQVVAVECSAVALANARATWPEDQIEWIEHDIRTLPIPENEFDIIVVYGLLHCMRIFDEVEQLVARLQRGTKVRGHHVLCAFNTRFQDLSAHQGFQPCLLGHDSYLKFYQDWLIEAVSDDDLTEVHPHNNITHTHSLTRLIAKKLI